MAGEAAVVRVRPGVPTGLIVADPVSCRLLKSLLAPVVTITVADPAAVGVPETGS